jgi:hypothetical protein
MSAKEYKRSGRGLIYAYVQACRNWSKWVKIPVMFDGRHAGIFFRNLLGTNYSCSLDHRVGYYREIQP